MGWGPGLTSLLLHPSGAINLPENKMQWALLTAKCELGLFQDVCLVASSVPEA